MVSSVSSSGMQNSALATQMAQMRAQMFKKSDSDSSGGLNVEEFKAMVAQGPGRPPGADASSSIENDFASFDADGDGSLTQTELDAGVEARMAEFRSTVDRFGGGPGGPGGPPPGPPPDSGSSDDEDESDPLQTLMAALEGTDAKSQKVADQLRQLLQGLMDDSGTTSGSSLSVAA